MVEPFWLLVALVIGVAIGRSIEAWTWRHNAVEYRRKDSWGRLYKVTLVD